MKGKNKLMVNRFCSFCWKQCSAKYFWEIIDLWQRSNLLQSCLTAVGCDLPAHVLLGAMRFSTAHLTHSNSTLKVTASVCWLSRKGLVWTSSLRWCTKYVLTYKVLPMALVSHFSLDHIDTINLYSMTHYLQDLWTQQTLAIVGACGHWYHLVSLALSLAHTILFLKDWSTRSCLWASWRETGWSLWVVICRKSWCRSRHPSWHGLL